MKDKLKNKNKKKKTTNVHQYIIRTKIQVNTQRLKPICTIRRSFDDYTRMKKQKESDDRDNRKNK